MANTKLQLELEAKKMCYFVVGEFFYTLALELFLSGNNIAAGGFSGIGIVVTSFLPISLGLFTFLLNLPFLLLAFFAKGQGYALRTLLGSAIFSILLETFSFLPTVTYNRLVAAVFGGLLYGFGAVFILKSESSSGSTDLVARLLKTRFPAFSLGKVFILVDGSVVLFAMIMFRDIEAGLYALITIYVCSIVNDRILQGFDQASMCYIITDHDPEGLFRAIHSQLDRSVTLQRGTGMYAGNERNILITVLRPKETWILKKIVAQQDPNAFVVVASASEVLGRGFKGVEDDTPKDALELHLKHPAH